MGVEKTAKGVRRAAIKANTQDAPSSDGLLSTLKVDKAALDTELDSIFKSSVSVHSIQILPSYVQPAVVSFVL